MVYACLFLTKNGGMLMSMILDVVMFVGLVLAVGTATV